MPRPSGMPPSRRMRASPASSAASGDLSSVSMPRRSSASHVEIRPRRIRHDRHRRRLTKLRQGAVDFVARQKARTDRAREGRVSSGRTRRRRARRRGGEGGRRARRRSHRNCARQHQGPARTRPDRPGSVAGRPIIECSQQQRSTSRRSCRWRSARSGRLASRSISDACREADEPVPNAGAESQRLLATHHVGGARSRLAE